MTQHYYRKRPRKPCKRLLKGYELQSVLYGTAIPLSGLFTAVAALLLAKAVFARRFLNAYHGITELRRMDAFQFEHDSANLFRRLGYAAKVTARSGDKICMLPTNCWISGEPLHLSAP